MSAMTDDTIALPPNPRGIIAGALNREQVVFELHELEAYAREAVRLYIAGRVGAAFVLPAAGSKEQYAAIEALMKERRYPCAPMGCARIGWEAARRTLAASAPTTPPDAQGDDHV